MAATGMDDRDDPNDLITLEAMRGLSKVLAKVEEVAARVDGVVATLAASEARSIAAHATLAGGPGAYVDDLAMAEPDLERRTSM